MNAEPQMWIQVAFTSVHYRALTQSEPENVNFNGYLLPLNMSHELQTSDWNRDSFIEVMEHP